MPPLKCVCDMTRVIKNKKERPEELLDEKKIYSSIIKAMKFGSGLKRPKIARLIAEEAMDKFSNKESVTAKDICKFILKELNEYGQTLTANSYERYQTVKAIQSTEYPLDNEMNSIIDGTNVVVSEENANKNADLASTGRDLRAGVWSRSYSERKLIPPHLMQAHDEGLIHIHDTDYLTDRIHNCQLINLYDMLWNGTVINGKKIERPHSFRTAATVATQISLSVANGQYGGQTMSVSHLAPFVRISYEREINKVKKEHRKRGINISDDDAKSIAYDRVCDEVKDGVQTIQFQENTFSSANGQTPFISLFLWVNEMPGYEQETAMIIKEILELRKKGMLNEQGIWVTPAFPKLLYLLDETNTEKGGKYTWLTDLAVQCVATRSNPDFISGKIMREQYEGNVFPCMGAVGGEEVIAYKIGDAMYCESFTRMWNRLSEIFEIVPQFDEANPNVMMWLKNVTIFDCNANRYVECKNIIRNVTSKWQKVTFDNGRTILCTPDHPFTLTNGETVQVDNLKYGDEIEICTRQICDGNISNMSTDNAWLLGMSLFKLEIGEELSAMFYSHNEDDTLNKMVQVVRDVYHFHTKYSKKVVDNVYYNTISINCKSLKYDLIHYFEGVGKNNRHIPNVVYQSVLPVRLAFLAGLIDGDGFITEDSMVEIHTLNKELALQIIALAQSCGMYSQFGVKTYTNKNGVVCHRNKVIFRPTQELISYIMSAKKRANYKDMPQIELPNVGKVTAIDEINETDFSYDVETETEHFTVSQVWSHNCRSFLSPWKDENGEYKFYGRWNRGVVTINLPDVALSANKDIDKFWEIFDERLELVKEALIMRHNLLKNTTVNKSPIHWKYGSIARLTAPNFNELMENGYSSISLGYIGLYEMSQAMFGKPHTDPETMPFAKEVMQKLNDKAKLWSDTIPELKGCSVYGTPSESLCYKFALKTRKRFGEMKNITDKDWFTNSYHYSVFEEVDAFTKLSVESEFQLMSKGGAVSYVEIPDLKDNLDVIWEIVRHIYNTCLYAELNLRTMDACLSCGFEGELSISDDGEWYCPNCGEKRHTFLYICKRICGYLGNTFPNKGKTMEMKKRVKHI